LGLEGSDHELLQRFVGGEEAAFTVLMRRHEDRIFALAYRITGNRADALEATQETFISMLRASSSFRGTSEVGTWLYRIGMNASRDVLRRRRRAPTPEGEPDALVAPTCNASVEEVVSARVDLSRALATLPEDYREAVVLHDLGGVPYEEIARLTGVALGTVKSRISRGRRRLARELEHDPAARASKDSL
jgi:RNA polymerase sigma-70 factor (ECF subfamily)